MVETVKESAIVLGGYFGMMEERRVELREARKEGLALGREEGLELGREEGKLSVLLDLIKSGDLTVEKAAKKLDISVEKMQKYLK